MASKIYTFAWFHKMAVTGILDRTKKRSSITDSEADSPGTHQSDDSGSNLLDPFRITRDQYLADRNGNTRGTANPSIMDKPLWKYMIAGGLIWTHLIGREGSVFSARKHRLHFDDEDLYKDLDENPDPERCFDRSGGTATELPDGRLVLIGGEHEDSYDPDFCIYNDVVLLALPQPSNSATSLTPEGDVIPDDHRRHLPYPTSPESITIYGYPVDVFPPTDFHTSTYFRDPINGKEFIYIIGGLGYYGSSMRDRTDVYRLDLIDFSIQLLETSGAKPGGGTYDHKALLVGDGEDTEAAIKILTKDGKAFSLLIKRLEWITEAAPCLCLHRVETAMARQHHPPPPPFQY